uniref:Reverse transcriptase domain-containing protein n=1 Tax=Tanacetum cinerariifolium TaxID=118510 RepID=A0A6L2JL12_TANCI|nr:reverse transcriptase domain-containing protein [Tanacetum cinerariifolium]
MKPQNLLANGRIEDCQGGNKCVLGCDKVLDSSFQRGKSGVAYDGPTIPPTHSPIRKEVKRETEATKDKVQATSSKSTAHVQPLVVQVPISDSEVALKPNPKPSIPYPSRLNDQKLREKDNIQMLKYLQIFQRLHFDISFPDALLHMPKFSSTFKSLLSNKEKLFELTSTPLNENCSAVLLKKLPEKLGVPGKFLIPSFTPETYSYSHDSRARKLIVDYDVDPRVPLILERPFLRTSRALINVHGEELTLQVNDEAITFKVEHTLRYSRNYYEESVNRIDVIDVSCEEYAQKVLEFSDSSTSGNLTPSDPIIASFSPSFTPFEGSDFILEEIETFLRTPNELTNLDDDYYDMEGYILYLEKLLNEDPSPNLPLMKNDDLKQVDVTMTKPLIEEPPKLELNDLPSHLEYAFLEGTDKLPVIIFKELKDKEKAALLTGGMTVVENEDNELIPTRLVTRWRVCIDYCKLNDATCKEHFPLPFMDQMLERLAGNEYYCFLDRFSGYFQIPIDPQDQEKTTFTCPYGTIEFDRAKVDVIAKLPHPTFVKGAENLAADNLLRLENPHEGDLEKKEINETFPLETLRMISFHGNSNTPWFADIANYHAGNFVV